MYEMYAANRGGMTSCDDLVVGSLICEGDDHEESRKHQRHID